MGSTISGPPSVLHKMKSFGPKSKFSNKRFPRSHGENYLCTFVNIVQELIKVQLGRHSYC